jgi:protein-S-isoprenylcysteine O-methyltransferase Ste14
LLSALGLAFLITGYLYLLVFVAVEEFLRKSASSRTIKGGEFDRKSTMLIGGAFGVGFLLPLALDGLDVATFSINSIEVLLSIVLMTSGLVIRVWAAVTLGRFYTRTLLVEREQKLVTSGPYARVRHPGYLGSMITWSGFGVATSNSVAALVLPILFIAGYLYRIGAEERMLVSELGDDYVRYRQRTRKLVPFVY